MTINITPGWNITPGTIVKDYNISDLFQFTTPTIISTANTMEIFSLAVNSNDTFVAVGAFGATGGLSLDAGYTTSKDGVNWTEPNYFNANINEYYGFYTSSMAGVASSPNSNLFVAVGTARYGQLYNGQPSNLGNVVPIVTISTNGTTWTTPSVITQNYVEITSVAMNSAGRSVAIGWDQNTGYSITSTSTDGITWTTPAPISTDRQLSMWSIAVNPSNVFVAVGQDSNSNGYSFTSVNGTAWSGPFLLPYIYYKIRWLGSPFNTFLIIAYNGGIPKYSTSTDGINWSAPVTSKSAFQDIASNKNGYIVGTYIPSTSYYSVSSNISGLARPDIISALDTTYRNFNSTSTDFNALSVVSDSSGRFVVVGASPHYPNNFAMYSTSYNILY